MTRTNLAALALLAGVTIAAPAVICSAADSEMQTAQAQTTAQPPNDQQGQDGMRGMMGREGRGRMGEMRHMMMNRSPKERCEERLARRAGFIAYTVAKLNLTAQQKPLWDKLNAIVSDVDHDLAARRARLLLDLRGVTRTSTAANVVRL